MSENSYDIQAEINFGTQQRLVQQLGELTLAKCAAEAAAASWQQVAQRATQTLQSVQQDVERLKAVVEGPGITQTAADATPVDVFDSGYKSAVENCTFEDDRVELITPAIDPAGDTITITDPILHPGDSAGD